MPRLDPPMKWSWVEPSSCRGTHPQPPRAKPFSRVLCLVLLPVHRRYRDGVLWLGGTPSWRFGGWPVTCSDVIGEKDAEQGRHSTPLAGGCGRAVWQQRAPPPSDADGGGVRLVGGQQSSSTRLVGRCGRAVWRAILGKA